MTNYNYKLMDSMMITTVCARPACQTAARSSCSGCGFEHYCGSDCQKSDWIIHKSMCPTLKKLSNKLQPYGDVIKVFDEIIASKKGNNRRILEHLQLYAEFQFGEQITGIGYRVREKHIISHWDAEIFILQKICCKLTESYASDNSLSTSKRHEKMSPYLEKSLSLLNPWLVYFDPNANYHTDSNNVFSGLDNQTDGLNVDQINYLLVELCRTEQTIAISAMYRNQFDVAEGHCQRSLTYSRKLGMKGDIKTSLIFGALRVFVHLRERQGDILGAVPFAEERYNLVVDADNPVHIQVQEAASMLINCLIHTNNLYDAERYAQVTYESLRDHKNGIDQNSEEVAEGSFNLANVIRRQGGNMIRAEKLAREALRIRDQLHVVGSEHNTNNSRCLLANILRAQKNCGDETKELYERCVASCLSEEGPDSTNTASAYLEIGDFYLGLLGVQVIVNAPRSQLLEEKRSQLLLVKSYFEKASRIFSQVYGPDHPTAAESTFKLSLVSNICREFNFL